MSRRFVLRDVSGALRGYLVQDDAGICCRAMLTQEAELTVLCKEARAARYALKADGGECVLPACIGEITGGYIADQSGLILATDEAARRAWRRLEASRSDAQSRNEAQKPRAADHVPESDGANAYAADMPQGRWPPPPCMPGARYEQGKWMMRSGDRPVKER